VHNSYNDIRSRIAEPPTWFDDNGCPRYGDFSPDLVPNIYVDEVILLLIGCQGCPETFKVSMSVGLMDRVNPANPKVPHPSLRDRIVAKGDAVHYGDPPNHVVTDHGGSTMNCYDLKVLEYWKRPDRPDADVRWVRVPELEIELEDITTWKAYWSQE
jgi:hypothetical protein